MANEGKASYAPKRQQEKLQDAMAVYQQDQKAGLRAIAEVDPAMALEVEQQSIKNSLDRSTQAANQAYRRSQIENADALAQSRAFDLLGRRASVLGKDNWAGYANALHAQAAKLGVNLPPPPAEFNQEWVDTLKRVGSSVYNSTRLDQLDQGQAITQQNADTNAYRAQITKELGEMRLAQQREIADLKLKFEKEKKLS